MLPSMLTSPLPPSFLDTCSLSMLSLGYKALYIVMCFLVLWSICWSFSPVHFKNGPEYLTTQMFIPLMRFLLYSLVSSSFLVLLRSYFSFFFLLSTTYWWFPLPSICKFPFLRAFWFFLDFLSFIPFVICRFPLSIISIAHFSMPNTIPTSSLYILTTCITVSKSFSFFGKQFDDVHVH